MPLKMTFTPLYNFTFQPGRVIYRSSIAIVLLLPVGWFQFDHWLSSSISFPPLEGSEECGHHGWIQRESEEPVAGSRGKVRSLVTVAGARGKVLTNGQRVQGYGKSGCLRIPRTPVQRKQVL